MEFLFIITERAYEYFILFFSYMLGRVKAKLEL